MILGKYSYTLCRYATATQTSFVLGDNGQLQSYNTSPCLPSLFLSEKNTTKSEKKENSMSLILLGIAIQQIERRFIYLLLHDGYIMAPMLAT